MPLSPADRSPGFWGQGGEPAGPSSEPLLMETSKPILLTSEGREPVAKGPMKALVAGGMHYIRAGDGSEELYSVRSDPEEQFNVASESMAGEVLLGFRERLAAVLRRR